MGGAPTRTSDNLAASTSGLASRSRTRGPAHIPPRRRRRRPVRTTHIARRAAPDERPAAAGAGPASSQALAVPAAQTPEDECYLELVDEGFQTPHASSPW